MLGMVGPTTCRHTLAQQVGNGGAMRKHVTASSTHRAVSLYGLLPRSFGSSSVLNILCASRPSTWQRRLPCTTNVSSSDTLPSGTSSSDESATGNGNGNGNGNGSSSSNGGALARHEYGKFVQFFRQASPYIEGHRGRIFVIVVPGRVTYDRLALQAVMSDIALLHGLGVQVVIVVGSQQNIDEELKARGMQPKYVGGYRITDKDALKICTEEAGQIRLACEQFLSKGPAIPMIRRHTKSDREIHFEPALRVISGNYVTAKRRGIIDGVDFGYTGEVRFVIRDDIKRQLDSGNIVMLGNMGFTASGEVLNCNVHDVGLHAAVELGADKLFFMHMDEVNHLELPHWLPLSDAQDMLLNKLQKTDLSVEQLEEARATMDSATEAVPLSATFSTSPYTTATTSAAIRARTQKMRHEELVVNLDIWSSEGFPQCVSTCVIACCKGVKRAHLLDARIDGGLLLELYSRDGVGTMISADFYEGIRKARPLDVDAIEALFSPLEKAGILVKRSREQIADMLPDLTVIEREGKAQDVPSRLPSNDPPQVMGCALLLPLGCTPDGVSVAEIGAFCVEAAFRGSGRGDSLLDYLEQDARKHGIRRLVLLTTRTADWFEQRDFRFSGPAYASELLPETRRSKINPSRNAQLYVKDLEIVEGDIVTPGKRIGF